MDIPDRPLWHSLTLVSPGPCFYPQGLSTLPAAVFPPFLLQKTSGNREQGPLISATDFPTCSPLPCCFWPLPAQSAPPHTPVDLINHHFQEPTDRSDRSEPMAGESRPGGGWQPGGVPGSDLLGPSERKGAVTTDTSEQQARTVTFRLRRDPVSCGGRWEDRPQS